MILIVEIEFSHCSLHFWLTIDFIQHHQLLHSKGLTNITLAYFCSVALATATITHRGIILKALCLSKVLVLCSL